MRNLKYVKLFENFKLNETVIKGEVFNPKKTTWYHVPSSGVDMYCGTCFNKYIQKPKLGSFCPKCKEKNQNIFLTQDIKQLGKYQIGLKVDIVTKDNPFNLKPGYYFWSPDYDYKVYDLLPGYPKNYMRTPGCFKKGILHPDYPQYSLPKTQTSSMPPNPPDDGDNTNYTKKSEPKVAFAYDSPPICKPGEIYDTETKSCKKIPSWVKDANSYYMDEIAKLLDQYMQVFISYYSSILKSNNMKHIKEIEEKLKTLHRLSKSKRLSECKDTIRLFFKLIGDISSSINKDTWFKSSTGRKYGDYVKRFENCCMNL